jgi:hypothetical protein
VIAQSSEVDTPDWNCALSHWQGFDAREKIDDHVWTMEEVVMMADTNGRLPPLERL